MELPGAKHVYHLYVVRHPKREAITEAITKQGIGTATHYPTTLPDQPAFQALGLTDGSWPVSDAWAADCFSLPLYPEIPDAHLERVAEVLRALPA